MAKKNIKVAKGDKNKKKSAKPAPAKKSPVKKLAKLVKKVLKVAAKKPVKPAKAPKAVVAKAPKAAKVAAPKKLAKAPVAAKKPLAPAPAKKAEKVTPAPKAAKASKAAEAKENKGRVEEVVEEAAEFDGEDTGDEEIVLTDAEGRRYCRVKDCDQLSSVDAYCRYHYLLFWKKIQVRKKILTEGKLERYIEDLTARYPDKFLDMLRKDLRSEKEFLAAIQELEIDESAVDNEFEDEAQTYIDEVRGMGEATGGREEEDF